ncbi:heterokaryon incompatibility protein-domain-containing protein [Sordaria brevicollis]|uniref:Heterokaryon incompatibility protein-domain-containing protein n=1 Tax=Sordaria brevicollis TaxID=83679 RepID=A0AAE0PM42_SORBR|nr:heterokaryon incompatibility protein-domain-containing protein [Sordaria brevicollis]
MESFKPSGASTHRPLQGNEIRIVTLHPASFEDPVFCTLNHVGLDGPRDDYIALSYAWGDPNETVDINLNGHSYPVTTNLHLALTYLRNKENPRRLWIDSLCINQRDVAERNAQIPRMRDIYAFAAEVHVWLGDSGSHLDGPSRKRTLKELEEYLGSSYSAVVVMYTKLGTIDILRRPWFQRMWVIQELAVRDWAQDRENVKFFIGHLSLTWSIILEASFAYNTFMLTPWSLYAGGLFVFQAILGRTNPLVHVHDIWEVTRHSTLQISRQLGTMLSWFVNYKVTDPRDRIYSLLGLLNGSGNVPDELAPDYSKPTDEVFHAYATWMLQYGGCVDILSLNSRQRAARDFASWVPDFEGQVQRFWQNPLETNPIRVVEKGLVLEVDALTLGTVRTLGNRCKMPDMYSAMPCEPLPYLRYLEAWTQDNSHESTKTLLGKYFKDSYNAVTLSGYTKGDIVPEESYDAIFAHLDDALERADSAQAMTANSWTSDAFPYAAFITNEFNGFIPFICDNGTLEFCNNKYILRRAPSGFLGEWIMVGTTYLASEWNYLQDSPDDEPKEETHTSCDDSDSWIEDELEVDEEKHISYNDFWAENKDKVFKALIC